MIRNSDTHRSRVIGRNQLTFRARVLDRRILRRTRSNAGFLNGGARSNSNFASGLQRFHPCILICFDCASTATDIRPVVRRKPANGQSVDKHVGLLPQIEDGYWAARARQQKLETIRRKFAAARSMKIGQAGV